MDTRQRIETMRKLLDDLKGQLRDEQLQVTESMSREDLIRVLTEWREEHGIGASARYMKNRSTGQLRKMYLMVQEGSTYRVGRKIPKKTSPTVTQK